MKKSYFMRTFNLNILLIVSSILAFLLEVLLRLALHTWDKSPLFDFKRIVIQIYHVIQSISELDHFMGTVTLVLSVILTAKEWTSRIYSDNILNWFRSVKQTLSLRKFMRQSERSEKIVDAQKVTSLNPINDRFNRSVRLAVVDIRRETAQIFIKVPCTQQTQKILKELETQIKEEVSSQNPDYIFSNFERHHNQLWLQGTKR
ncbi:hypothetical protein [Lactococcus petauri]|uniref:hypothetical protein n=1 Tax=Lactococcus petauri TaxID=1940789 RepID=UPI00232C4BED|nr:hypothetical protein [Lactococcus petauri]MDC0825846.1 hypothetical protein [Lactococcus petauri]